VSDCPETNSPSPDEDRRGFLTKLCLGLSGLIGAMITLPGVGFVLAPVFARPKQVWRKLGMLD